MQLLRDWWVRLNNPRQNVAWQDIIELSYESWKVGITESRRRLWSQKKFIELVYAQRSNYRTE
jgi:hypothetical protein